MEKLNFAKVTILSGVVTCFRLICGLLISKVVAIYTGPIGIANLGQLQNFVAFINGFISSQVSQGVNRYSAENQSNYEKACFYWRASIKLSFIACCFIISIGVLFSSKISEYLFHQTDLYWLIIIALCALPLNIVNNIFLGVLNGLNEYNRFFLANILAISSSLLSMVGLVYFFGLKGALISASLNNAVAGIWLITIIIKRPWFKFKYWVGHTPRDNITQMKNYFYMGVIGALTGPVSMIVVRTILTNNFSLADAGYWQAVNKISEAYLAVLTTALTVYYFPKTAAAKKYSEYITLLKTGACIVVPLALIMALTIYVLKDFIISILFTADFIRARELFLFQNIGDFLRICSWLFATILLAKGYFKINAMLEVIFSIIFPVMVKLLITKFRLNSVSIAYSITYALYFVVVCIIYYWHLTKKVL